MERLTAVEELKIGLMTYGMGVTGSARSAISGANGRPLTLADYASTSGISMELEDDVWVNAPIMDHNPNFVDGQAPYTLDHSDGNFFIGDGSSKFPARPIPVPSYHSGSTDRGEKYMNLAITHTDRVRISPIEGCALACNFCDLPREYKYRKKGVEDLVDSVAVALKDPTQSAKHVLISGGTPVPKDYAYLNGVYRKVAEAFPDVDVDVMMVPMPGLLDARELKEMGINGLSINMELYNQEIAEKIMIGKERVTRERYLDFISGAVPLFGEGNVRSLMMVGIEPIEDTLRGIRALAERGCDPVLSPFRPDPNTPMRDESPPSIDELKEVYLRAREITEEYPGVKLGPRCIPCMHNTLTFPDDSGEYSSH